MALDFFFFLQISLSIPTLAFPQNQTSSKKKKEEYRFCGDWNFHQFAFYKCSNTVKEPKQIFNVVWKSFLISQKCILAERGGRSFQALADFFLSCIQWVSLNFTQFCFCFINTSKTHQLRRSLWGSKPSPENSLWFEPTWLFWNPLVLAWLRYKTKPFPYLLYSMMMMISVCIFFGLCLTSELCSTCTMTDWTRNSQTPREGDFGSDLRLRQFGNIHIN